MLLHSAQFTAIYLELESATEWHLKSDVHLFLWFHRYFSKRKKLNAKFGIISVHKVWFPDAARNPNLTLFVSLVSPKVFFLPLSPLACSVGAIHIQKQLYIWLHWLNQRRTTWSELSWIVFCTAAFEFTLQQTLLLNWIESTLHWHFFL